MVIYTEFSTFLFGQRLEVRTDPEGAEFYKVNYFPAARNDLYIYMLLYQPVIWEQEAKLLLLQLLTH